MKRALLILSVPVLVSLGLLIALKYLLLPRALDWALQQGQIYSQKNLPVVISAKHASVGFTNLALSIDGITIAPNDPEVEKYLHPIQIENISANLDFLQILLGRLQISSLVIAKPEVRLKLDAMLVKSNEPNRPLPVDQIFSILEKIPLQKLWVQNLSVLISGEKSPLAIAVDSGHILISNRLPLLAGKAQFAKVVISAPDIPKLETSVDTHIAWTKQALNILSFQMKYKGLNLDVKGQLQDFKNITVHPKARIQISTQFGLEKLIPIINHLRPQLRLPVLAGNIDAKGELELDGIKKISGEISTQAENLFINKYEVGSFSLLADVKPEELKLKNFRLNHSSGEVSVQDAKLRLEAPFDFTAKVQAKKLDLHKLFQSIQLPDIPVWLQTMGTFECQGTANQFKMICDGDVQAKDLVVQTEVGANHKKIIEVDRGQAKGSLELNNQGIQINSILEIGKSRGTIVGEVLFREGFAFEFSKATVDFSDIKNLANLKFAGLTNLSGQTQGNSKTATLDLALAIQDFQFEKYNLGAVQTNLAYRDSHLRLENVKAVKGSSNYVGNLDVDFHDPRIKGKVEFSQGDLADIRQIFSDVYLLPIEVLGQGRGRVDFEGPLDFWKLSYDLMGEFQNGTIAGEGYQSLRLRLSSLAGNMKVQNFEIVKGASSIKVTGGIDDHQNIDLHGEMKNWRLEDSEIAGKVRSNMIGAFNVNSSLSGSIRDPRLSVRGHLADIYLEEQEIPSSFFSLKLDKKTLNLESNLLGNKIQADMQLPLNSSGLPLKLKIKTKEWAFTQLLSLVGASKLQSEYESALTADVDLISEQGDWNQMTGKLQIPSVFLKRNSSRMANVGSIEILWKNGKIQFQDFHLKGPDQDLRVEGKDFSFEHLNFSVNSKMDLRLLQIFTPFLEELGGPLDFSATFNGSLWRPQILGNAKVRNGFVKLKGLAHPVDKLQFDVIFSQQRIILQNIEGGFGGGEVKGEGTVNIHSLNDIPISIRIRADGVNLEIPEKVKTAGRAELAFSGNHFPFVLSGNYFVSNALVEKEFGEGEQTIVKQSPYLPKVLKEASFQPILLDLHVHFEKPVQVKNSQMDAAMTGNLQIKGSPQNPILFGRMVTDKPARLFFKDKVFDIQNGTIKFENPDEVNPDLYISAQSRVADYDVNLLVQGPAKSATFRLSSVPPLPDPDIVSLLALGVTSSRLDQNIQSKEQATRVGYEAGAAIFSQTGIDKYAQKKLGVNVQITSSFDSSKNVSVPKLTFSKSLGKKWNASVSRTAGAEQSSSDVKLQYLINNNLSAVGSYESREATERSSLGDNNKQNQSIFGLDLELKRKFK